MATSGADKPSVFAVYVEKAPAPIEPTPSSTTPLAALELLNWIQHVWKQPTVRAKNIYQFGPNSIRDKKSALEAAEKLVERGWLAPMKTRRHDTKEWRVMNGFD